MQEKQIQLVGLNINYKIIGAGKTPVVLLHGWGISSDKYIVTAEEILEQNSGYVFYIPDLPGFGKSEEPKEDWKLDDYVGFTEEFIKNVAQRDGGFEPIGKILEKAVICPLHPDPLPMGEGTQRYSTLCKEGGLKIKSKKIILIGHSNGGRIAIKYAEKYPEDLEKLFLTGAAGIKHSLTLKQKLFFYSSKAGKKVFSLPVLKSGGKYARKFLYKLVKEKDYASASPRMKEIMKNVLAEDLIGILDKIKVPTVLIWGREDHSTPLQDGELMHKKIANSKLFIIENANHSALYNNAKEFAEKFTNNSD
jgi:pimeloyl-ACP methyl ester carboxylesterase